MENSPGWTLEQLVRRVGLALDRAARSGGYPGVPNGRVREMPDQRAIRWYTTTGLVDRPIGGRGRGARYGSRHLCQLVAIKRLQAEGASLAQIQARLTGADDETLARLAGVPAETLDELDELDELGDLEQREQREAAPPVSPARAAARFGAAPPSAPAPGRPPAAASGAGPGLAPPADVAPPADAAQPVPLTGLQLTGGVLLVLLNEVRDPNAPNAPNAWNDLSPEDLAALSQAAQPLLSALSARGLIARQNDPEGAHP